MSGYSEHHDDHKPATVPAPSAAADVTMMHSLELRSQLLAVALAVVTLLLVGSAAGFLLWYSHEKTDRQNETVHRTTELEHEAGEALSEARNLSDLANTRTEQPLEWQAHLTASEESLKRADNLLKVGNAREDLKEKADGQHRELDQAKKNLAFSNKLDAMRLRRPDGQDQADKIAKAYAGAFKEFGSDVALLDAPLSAKRLMNLPNRDAVVDGLLDWSDVTPDGEERKKIIVVVTLIEPDSNSVLRRVAETTAKKDRVALVKMAADEYLPSMSPRSLRRLADGLYQLGAEPEAVKVLRQAQQTFPQDFWLNYSLGTILVRGRGARERTDSLRFLSAAAALRPPNAPLYNSLGLALRNNGEIGDAVKTYQTARQLDSSNIAILNNLGIALQLMGDVDAAVDVLSDAEKVDPKRLETQINLGAAYQAKGDLVNALVHFNTALEIDPNSATAHTSKGLTLESQGDIDGAIAEHKKALAIEPKSIQAQNNYGTALAAKGELDEAVNTFHAALEIDPQFPATYINLGSALRNKGDFDGALRALLTAAELSPRDSLPHEHIAFILALKNEMNGAAREYRTALDLNPNSAAAYIGLSQALIEKGQLNDAIAILKEGAAKLPETNKLKATVRIRLGEYQSWGRLEERLRPVLIGEERLGGPDEQLEFARLCLFLKHLYNTSAVFYAEAFNNRPEMATDLRAGNRFDAACAAAMAGSGQGEDVASFQELDRHNRREQSRRWLEEDLALWTKIAASDKSADRTMVRAALLRWQQDPHLIGVRNKDALQKLLEPERSQWLKFWDDVEGVLNQMRQKK